MSDFLHKVITTFRDSFKSSIFETIENKFAVLESQLRDQNINTTNFVNKDEFNEVTSALNKIIPVIEDFVSQKYLMDEMRNKVEHLTTMNEIKAVQYSPTTKNIVIEHEPVANMKMDGVWVGARPNEEVEIPDCESPTKFTPLEVDGTTYWLDNDHIVYKETDEGYEEIGSYDPETGEISMEDEEMEEEEEGVEMEEFKYKGKTYFRDEDNNVYNAEGEEVGTWTGTSVKFV